MLTVYLDSSDYSALSDPRRETQQRAKTRDELLELAADPRVRFAFSGAHLSEMAPLEAQYTPAAVARAELLERLCGRHAFVSLDLLMEAEVARLINKDESSVLALRVDGTWFPDLGDIVSPINWGDAARDIDETARTHGANREARRAAKRKMFKGGKLKAPMKAFLAAQDPTASVEDIVARYPMLPQNAEALNKYVLGQGTRADAEEAFRASLRDPSWMIRWFADHHGQLSHVIDWMRGPARTLAEKMRETIAPLREFGRLRDELPRELQRTLPGADQWHARQDEQVLSVIAALARKRYGSCAAIDASQVDHYCPGLSTAIRSLHSAAWDSLSPNPREPQNSDFIDAIHSMYAPYSDVFRADRYMASHIKRYVNKHGTRVVSKLQDLPSTIREAL